MLFAAVDAHELVAVAAKVIRIHAAGPAVGQTDATPEAVFGYFRSRLDKEER